MDPQRKKGAGIIAPNVPPDSPSRNSSRLSKLRLDKLDAKRPLTDKCLICESDLKSCLSYAYQAGIDVEQVVKAQLGVVQKRLEDIRLRLDIWISDCSVLEGLYLDNLGGDITKVVGRVISTIHEQLSAIAIEIGQLWQVASKRDTERKDN
jgi:hypothetical protein